MWGETRKMVVVSPNYTSDDGCCLEDALNYVSGLGYEYKVEKVNESTVIKALVNIKERKAISDELWSRLPW